MKRDIADDEKFIDKIEKGKYFDFITPYGYGGWIIEGKDTERLFKEYSVWVKNNGIISEFVRFHPIIKNHEACKYFYEVTRLGQVVHMNLESPNQIWSNLTSKNRNVIRKAIKNNVMIYNGRFPEIYEKFHHIYNLTMNKNNAEKYYYFNESFYKSILEDLSLNAQVFYAEKDNEIISAAIILTANGRMNYHLSASLPEYSYLASTNLLLFKIALWGWANGYKTFYLGGGVGGKEDSLFKFKRAFYRGDDLNNFFIGKKIFDKRRYDELVAIRDDLTKRVFFPRYRA